MRNAEPQQLKRGREHAARGGASLTMQNDFLTNPKSSGLGLKSRTRADWARGLRGRGPSFGVLGLFRSGVRGARSVQGLRQRLASRPKLMKLVSHQRARRARRHRLRSRGVSLPSSLGAGSADFFDGCKLNSGGLVPNAGAENHPLRAIDAARSSLDGSHGQNAGNHLPRGRYRPEGGRNLYDSVVQPAALQFEGPRVGSWFRGTIVCSHGRSVKRLGLGGAGGQLRGLPALSLRSFSRPT